MASKPSIQTDGWWVHFRVYPYCLVGCLQGFLLLEQIMRWREEKQKILEIYNLELVIDNTWFVSHVHIAMGVSELSCTIGLFVKKRV